MIGMSTILTIKSRINKGDSIAQIARDEGISEPTVRKYRDLDDFSPAIKIRKERASKLDPFKPIIDEWMEQDKKCRVKQRHTAKRIFDRLVEEQGYSGGYTLVQSYVKGKKRLNQSANDQFLNLVWSPGEAQVDFGLCDFKVLGVSKEVHYLVVTFPCSNVSLSQCFWGENAECVCEGLKAIFEYCKGVPLRLIFDNATGIGRRIGEIIRMAETFKRFAAHYGFEYSFCNPDSGHEKGSVENAVGTIRRNLFVPTPRIDNLRSYNKRLLDKCMQRAEKQHYLRAEPEIQLFMEDRMAMLDLPAKPFKAVRHDGSATNKYGDVCLEGKHRYPLGPENAQTKVIVEYGAFEVSFYTQKGSLIATYERAYGDAPTQAKDPRMQLALLCKKPGAWRNSLVRAEMPKELRLAVDAMDKPTRSELLKALRDASDQSGYDAAIAACSALAAMETAPSRADILMSAALIVNGQNAVEYTTLPDLSIYDAVFTSEKVG